MRFSKAAIATDLAVAAFCLIISCFATVFMVESIRDFVRRRGLIDDYWGLLGSAVELIVFAGLAIHLSRRPVVKSQTLRPEHLAAIRRAITGVSAAVIGVFLLLATWCGGAGNAGNPDPIDWGELSRFFGGVWLVATVVCLLYLVWARRALSAYARRPPDSS